MLEKKCEARKTFMTIIKVPDEVLWFEIMILFVANNIYEHIK